MKKLLLLVAAACCMAACNKELGPEYRTPPQLGEVTYTPTDVQADNVVTVRVPITSTYGLYSGWIVYWLGEDQENAKSTTPYFYTKSDTSVIFEGKIPAQEAGSKVSFVVAAMNPYSVLASTQVYNYTVAGGSEPEPAPDEN